MGTKGMLAGVVVQVDQFTGGGNRLECSLFNGCWTPDKCDHRAIVVEIRMAVKDGNTVNRFDGLDNGLDDFRPARF